MDLIEDHQSQSFSYTRDAAKQMNGYRIVFRNLGIDLSFDSKDLFMDGIHQCGIHLNAGADHWVSEARTYAGTIGSAVDPFFKVREVVLRVDILDVHLKLCMLASKVQPTTKQVPGRAHALRIDIGHGKHPASQ